MPKSPSWGIIPSGIHKRSFLYHDLYLYRPGVCSRKMTVELENGVIKSVNVEGGCNGNLQGISRLVVGMDAQEAIRRMKGIHCGPKPTSCPDQMAHALEEALAQAAKKA